MKLELLQTLGDDAIIVYLLPSGVQGPKLEDWSVMCAKYNFEVNHLKNY